MDGSMEEMMCLQRRPGQSPSTPRHSNLINNDDDDDPVLAAFCSQQLGKWKSKWSALASLPQADATCHRRVSSRGPIIGNNLWEMMHLHWWIKLTYLYG